MAKVFVFGSNLAGRHGAGSALRARREFGAVYGRGVGRQGNSYAIPTKGYELERLTVRQISIYVKDFIDYATEHPNDQFEVVAVGCGLAGYEPKDIAPLFKEVPTNVKLPAVFKRVLDD